MASYYFQNEHRSSSDCNSPDTQEIEDIDVENVVVVKLPWEEEDEDSVSNGIDVSLLPLLCICFLKTLGYTILSQYSGIRYSV